MSNWIKEELDKGFFPPGPMFKRNLQAGGAFFAVMLKHPLRFTKDIISAWSLRVKAGKPLWASLQDEHTDYVTEKDIARVTKEDIERATHKEKYLRPTRLCKPNAPEIVALAKKLGAWEKSDWDYGESIFNFMRKVKFGFGPLKNAVEVLKTNKGMCLDQQSLAIALARAGGIPAKYSLTGVVFVPPVKDALTVDPAFGEAYNALGTWEQHGAAEFLIDGKWIATDVTFSDASVVGLGLPLPRFGTADIGLGIAPPEIITHFEGFPFGYSVIMKLAMALMRATADRINANVDEITENGRILLEQIGEEKYREQTAKKSGRTTTIPELPSLEEIETFKKISRSQGLGA
jgi:hypothetical protein